MDNEDRLKKIKVNHEKLNKFQLPRSYTIDSWSMEIDVRGKDTNTDAINSSKNNKINRISNNNKDNSKTKYKWLFVIVLILLILAVIGLIIAINKSRRNDHICLTSACIRTAGTSLQYLDETINPCDNFYDYACGNYGKDMKTSEIHKSIFGSGDGLVKNQLRSFFNEPLPSNVIKPLKYLMQTYNVCTEGNQVTIKEEMKLFISFLDKFGGWPTLMGNNWNESKFDWIQLTYDLRKIGAPFNYFFTIGVNEIEHNTTHYQLLISPIKEEQEYDAAAKSDLITLIAHAFGGNLTIIEKDENDVILFQRKLQKKRINNTYTVMTIKKLQGCYSNINWLKYLKLILNLPELKITEETFITLTENNLGNILELISQTPKRTLKNFIFRGLVQFVIQLLPKIFNRVFRQKTNNLHIALRSIPLSINYWYIKKYLTQETKNEVEEMVTNIKNEFQKTLENTPWLDEHTKAYAIKKIIAMTSSVGYPKELLNDTVFESFYNKLEVNFSSCLEAVTSIQKFNYDVAFKKLNLPFSEDWESIGNTVTLFNAYYRRTINKMVIPAAFLLNFIYDRHRPHYVNYARLGSVVGHEMTHGFDNNGRKYGADGNLYNWWSPNTTSTFEEKSQCMIKQYQKMQMFNTSINGTLTLPENIADNGGLKQAYQSYQSWLKHNGIEQKLPGLDLTQNQMFWVSYAQLWCEEMSESYFKQVSIYDCHSPNKCRVIGTLRNLESFSKDFNCPVGAPMNPAKKCIVW